MEGHVRQDRQEDLSAEVIFRQRCEQMKKTVVQKQFGISTVWNNGKYARIGSREYALQWTIAQPTLK